MDLKTLLKQDLIEWLLAGEPWVVYRMLTDLLDKDASERSVICARKAIVEHPLVKKIFNGLNRDGYWGKPKDIHTWWPRKETTFWVLPVLADFGLDVEDNRIARACEYVFSTQLESGGFGWDPPTKPGDCHSAIIIESLAKMGFLGDPRLRKAYEWLVGRQRLDGGFWCKDTGQIGGPREKEPCCALASTFVLGALAQNPELRDSKTARKGVDFLFECWRNRGKMKYAGHDSQIGTDWEKLKYQFTDYKILKFLDVLSQFDFARKRLQESEMGDLLLSKRDNTGRFTPESIIKVWSGFDFGQKDKPSRWITLLALRIVKRICERRNARD
ncbi:MAG: prenyltransferase/squalene oxidase repeat-containing protein [Candidatus Bathyarchaeia archaeon]